MLGVGVDLQAASPGEHRLSLRRAGEPWQEFVVDLNSTRHLTLPAGGTPH
jgi:hypothetical protein